jgi:protein gp37
MRSLLTSPEFLDKFDREFCRIPDWNDRYPDLDFARGNTHLTTGPLSNVWLGVSAEDQRWADIRIPALLDTPAAVRFVSAEPLLGPIDLREEWGYGPGIDWLIVGGESGPGNRPMHPDWARSLRDQRNVVGAAFLFKQWGGRTAKAGGRELDGRTWDQYPEAVGPC